MSYIDLKSFGMYLQNLRKDKGLTLIELSEKIGYSDAYISQVEKGRRKNRPTIEMLKALSEALDTPFSELLRKAGYKDLAEGQYYKELFDATGLNQSFPNSNVATEYSEELKRVSELMDIYYNGINKWSVDIRLSEIESIVIRDHFAEVLIRYKQLIEVFANSRSLWHESKDELTRIWGIEAEGHKAEQAFLKLQLEQKLEYLKKWIENFPEYMARGKLIGGENNGNDPKEK